MQTLRSRMTYWRNAELPCAAGLPAALSFYWHRSGSIVAWEVRLAALGLDMGCTGAL